MRVHLGSDHAGFELKNAVAAHLTAKGHEVVDHGAHEFDADDDYPGPCIAAAEAVVADPGSLGLVTGGCVVADQPERFAAFGLFGSRRAVRDERAGIFGFSEAGANLDGHTDNMACVHALFQCALRSANGIGSEGGFGFVVIDTDR